MPSLKFYGTSNANPHNHRRQSGLLLSIENNHYLFDCGDAIPSAMWNDSNIIFNDFNAVFFSHRHPDHIGGLPNLILLMHQQIKKDKSNKPGSKVKRIFPKKLSLQSKFSIFIPGDKKIIRSFQKMCNAMHMASTHISYAKEFFAFKGKGKIYEDNLMEVHSFPTFHVKNSSGFKIFVGDKKILYSGDIRSPKIVADVIGDERFDIVIIENAHFPTTEIAKNLKNKKIGKLLVTHRRDSILDDPKKTTNDLAPLAEKMDITLAEDDMEIPF